MHGDSIGSPIRWRMFIPVPPDVVYQALATDAGRASFWAESAIEADRSIDFVFANGYRHRAQILQAVRPSRFALTYFGGVAAFDLSSTSDGGTDLLLTHEGVPEADWIDTHAGWLNVLFPLKAMLAFGVDLRNHAQDRSWDRGYADQ
jgi:uncharacterized protein YndB with AHSA1/START domain